MTRISDEEIVTYVDGQMDAAGRAAFAARLEVDPGLAQRVAAHDWIARQIVAAYGAPPATEVDDALIAQLGLHEENVVTIASRRSARLAGFMQWATGIAAIAASIAVGFFVGRTTPPTETALFSQLDGRIVASGNLDDALSSKLSGEAGPIGIKLTFRTAEGVCRSFRLSSGASGIGCRQGGRWTVPILVDTRPDQAVGADYRLAGGDIAPEVMAEVDQRIEGLPYAPGQERELRDRGWRSRSNN